MNQGMVNSIIAAVVGGVVGACVVFFAGTSGKDNRPELDLANLEVANLKVASLTITDQAVLLNKEGIPEVALREGSIFAENVVIAKKLVGQQVQGHAIVANRVFTTPDDLIRVPMEQWRFFAEIGASNDAGGEIVIRNSNGAAVVNRATVGGALIRLGFDTESYPQIVALQNASGSVLPISPDLSEAQKQMVMTARANPQGAMPQGAAPNNPATGFNSQTATPAYGAPDMNMMPSAAQSDSGPRL